MISMTTNSGRGIWDIRGLSTDEKPVDRVPNGSTFYVMDAMELGLDNVLYMFDAENKKWLRQRKGGG